VPNSPDRRTFLDVLLGLSLGGLAAAAGYPVFRFLLSTRPETDVSTSVVAARSGEMAPGTARLFRFGTQPAILIHDASGEYRAMSAVCTHLQCTVQLRNDLGCLWCACHGGKYDLFGRNIAGPPPKPLERFEVRLSGDDIIVTRGGSRA